MAGFQTVRGMRDFLPEQAKKKQFIEDLCRKTFENYGFEPLQSPIVEEFGLLAAKGSAGEAIKEEIYYFRDKSERELGLRFDLTVPLARIAASNPSIAKPFKRYQIGTVYRYDRPQAKRYREFTQADVDIVGAKSVLADFECVQIGAEVLRKLGLEFKIRVNSRTVLEELAIKTGVKPEQVKDAFRLIDKLDKIGEKEVRKEFREKGIRDSILEKIFVNSFEEVKEAVGETEAVKGLGKLLELCRKNSLKEAVFDLGLARGLEYYTGSVFEIALDKGPSVGGGGRYDKLIEAYGGQPTPAVGISFGVDRLLDALEKSLLIGVNTDIFITPLSEEAAFKAFEIAGKLRSAGISVEVDLMERNLKKNLEYASRKGVPFIIVLGENELKAGKFKLKDMGSGKEQEFGFADAAGVLKALRKG